MTAPACFAVASAFLKGLRAKEGLYLRVSSLSCRFVSLLAGGACTLPDQKGFVSFVRIGGWCLHFACPRRFRFVRRCFPVVAVQPTSLNDSDSGPPSLGSDHKNLRQSAGPSVVPVLDGEASFCFNCEREGALVVLYPEGVVCVWIDWGFTSPLLVADSYRSLM